MDNLTDVNKTVSFLRSPFPKEAVTAYNGFLYVIIITGVIGNAMVLVVFKMIRPSTSTDWFVIFITLSDCVSSFANVPIYVTFTNGAWQRYGTSFLCKMHMILSQTVVLSSTFFICGLALDRYMKVCRQGKRTLSTNSAKNVCLLICAAAAILSTPCIVIFDNIKTQCMSKTLGVQLMAYYTFVFLTFVTAFVIVVFAYTKISLVVRQSERNVSRHGSKREQQSSSDNRWHCCPFSYFDNKVVPVSHENSDGLRASEMRGGFFGAMSENTVKVDSTLDPRRSGSIASKNITNSGTCITKAETGSSAVNLNQKQGGNVYCIEDQHSGDPVIQPENTVRSSINVNVPRQSMRTTKISFFVCFIFIVSWIPPWLSLFVLAIPGMRENVHVQMFVLFGKMTYLLNTVANPVIYTWLNRKFRLKVVKIFCCWKKR